MTRPKLALALAFLLFSAPWLLAQAKAPASTAAPASAPAPARRIASWTADKREYQVGDVITVLVTEATLATATKSQNGTDQQTRANAMAIAPPKVGPLASIPPIDGTLSSDKKSSSAQSGDAKRNMSFKGDISVRVVAVDKNGLLQVKGTKLLDVDKNTQTLNLTGWVRPEDVTPDNLVASERVADVALTYTLAGDIGGTRGGILGRVLSKIWP